jgi:hypothetical protein
MDSKDELLIILLKCGYADVDTLIRVMEMGDELFGENLLYDVIDEHGSEALCGFNDLMQYLMEEFVYRLVAELDEEIGAEDGKYRNILDDHWAYPYTNYMDSHFNIECLDGWGKDESREKLLSDLKNELDGMKNRTKR